MVDLSSGSVISSLNIIATTPDEILQGLTQTSQNQPIDIEDDGKASARASLSTLLSHRGMVTEGHLLKPVAPTEHSAVEALIATPGHIRDAYSAVS